MVPLPALREIEEEKLRDAGKLKIVYQMLMELSIRHQMGSQEFEKRREE